MIGGRWAAGDVSPPSDVATWRPLDGTTRAWCALSLSSGRIGDRAGQGAQRFLRLAGATCHRGRGAARQPPGRARWWPVELDCDEWLGAQLAGGAGVRELSRRAARRTVDSSQRAAALWGETHRERSGRRGYGWIRSRPALRRRDRAGRAGASGARRAWRLQSTAVAELHRTGLTVAAIVDRLATDVNLVEAVLAADSPFDAP